MRFSDSIPVNFVRTHLKSTNLHGSMQETCMMFNFGLRKDYPVILNEELWIMDLDEFRYLPTLLKETLVRSSAYLRMCISFGISSLFRPSLSNTYTIART